MIWLIVGWLAAAVVLALIVSAAVALRERHRL